MYVCEFSVFQTEDLQRTMSRLKHVSVRYLRSSGQISKPGVIFHFEGRSSLNREHLCLQFSLIPFLTHLMHACIKSLELVWYNLETLYLTAQCDLSK